MDFDEKVLINIAMEEADRLLDEAYNTKSKKKAMKLAEQAYLTCPDCLDALLYMVHLENNSLKKEELLEEGLSYEKDRLEKEGFFDKDCIGIFYGMIETRPYIRGLFLKAVTLLECGKIKLALDVCKEILRLNNNDNLGVRYTLMAIYAYLEDEKKALALFNKYEEESFSMLFPLFILYYKLGNKDKAIEYLKKTIKANANLVKLFKGTLDGETDAPEGYYARGDISEIEMYLNNFSFLLVSVPFIDEFALKYYK